MSLHWTFTGWVIEQSMDSVLPLVTAAQAVLIPVIIVSCFAIPSTSWHDLAPLYSTQISHWNLLPDHIIVNDRYPMNIRNEKVMILPLLMTFFLNWRDLWSGQTIGDKVFLAVKYEFIQRLSNIGQCHMAVAFFWEFRSIRIPTSNQFLDWRYINASII